MAAPSPRRCFRLTAIRSIEPRPCGAACRYRGPPRHSLHRQPGRDRPRRRSRALRSGVDITLDLQPPLRILARAPEDRLLRSSGWAGRKRGSCVELREQLTPLVDWISARHAEGIAFAMLGDFNRHMDGPDQFWSALQQAAPLTRATEGHASPCWGGEAIHRSYHARRRRARLAGSRTRCAC